MVLFIFVVNSYTCFFCVFFLSKKTYKLKFFSKKETTLTKYKEISKQQSTIIVEKMKEVVYLINNFNEITFDSEYKRRPDLGALIDEEILQHQ